MLIPNYIFSCEGKTHRVECLAGTYSPAGSDECTTCPKGAHCPTKTLETYILCANGTYSDTEGSSDCKLCDAGFRCPSVGMEAPLVCPNGTYSNTTGAVECILCPAGYRWDSVTFNWHLMNHEEHLSSTICLFYNQGHLLAQLVLHIVVIYHKRLALEPLMSTIRES